MSEKVTIQVSPELKNQIIKFYGTIQKIMMENTSSFLVKKMISLLPFIHLKKVIHLKCFSLEIML